eukprot:CAMPEP_0115256482 /NCGR_PEP_ID=MMETSP0270-20121206/46271_2 /TAXON_ID=71861 /ORGANISM="Scrippsiella trochoidea, Strain CCMP3099" /LENGTH=172 /DNA_ID=CAMNT_0002672141 /DNA_START=463 /DNA_END=977 /DNA_ORIENTATION=-
MPLVQPRELFAGARELTLDLGGLVLVPPQGGPRLRECGLEEVDVGPPDLLQHDSTLEAVLRHLPHDLVQADRQDRHELLYGLRQVLLGPALDRGLDRPLRVVREGPGDPLVQDDCVSPTARLVSREQDGLRHLLRPLGHRLQAVQAALAVRTRRVEGGDRVAWAQEPLERLA